MCPNLGNGDRGRECSMIRKKKLVVSAFAGFMLLVGGNVFARPPNNCAPNCVPDKVGVSAPEIDAGSGGSAIALLITAMLLASERKRRT
jgi:hypothetical protein